MPTILGLSHRKSLHKRLLNAVYALGYLKASFHEDGMRGLLYALGNVVEANRTTKVKHGT